MKWTVAVIMIGWISAAPADAQGRAKPKTNSASPTQNVAVAEPTTAVAIRGITSADSENAGAQKDPHAVRPLARPIRGLDPGSLGTRLAEHPRVREIMSALMSLQKGIKINIVLVGGQKYMINDCLGVKASAGVFRLDLPMPEFEVEKEALSLAFRVPRVELTALRVRLRPNIGNPAQPCHFGPRIGVGGVAEDITYSLRFDPIMTADDCRVAALRLRQHGWRIGKLKLEPLPPQVVSVGKDLINDALAYSANVLMIEGVVAALNTVAAEQCKR